jgi:hypothetical protein
MAPLKINDILSAIDSEIAHLSQVRELLTGNKTGTSPVLRKRRTFSAAARKRIGDAQRKRWAAQKKASAAKSK